MPQTTVLVVDDDQFTLSYSVISRLSPLQRTLLATVRAPPDRFDPHRPDHTAHGRGPARMLKSAPHRSVANVGDSNCPRPTATGRIPVRCKAASRLLNGERGQA
jgi:hypothetical protein